MIAIGKSLLARGFDVSISLAEPYASIAEAAGLEPQVLVSRESFDRLLSSPATWKLLRGMRRVVRGVASDFTEPHFELIERLHRPGRTVLVSHPLDFASRVFRDVDPQTPLVDVHLAPVMLRVADAPARLTSWPFEPTRSKRTFRLAYWLGDHLILDRLLGGPINWIRKRHGLEPVQRIMNEWWLSPDRVLALYPDWFAPSTVGALEQLRHVGFPLDDGSDDPFEIPEDRPVVFTGGSANWHTRRYFEQASTVCERIGVGALLLGSHPDCFPESLPEGVRRQRYAPLGKLLPHCSAIVHHGGIGTTSQGLRSGIPQLIRPMAFDQHDNAARMIELNAGRRLASDRQLEVQLRGVLTDPSIQAAAQAAATRLRDIGTGADRAAEEIVAVSTRTSELV